MFADSITQITGALGVGSTRLVPSLPKAIMQALPSDCHDIEIWYALLFTVFEIGLNGLLYFCHVLLFMDRLNAVFDNNAAKVGAVKPKLEQEFWDQSNITLLTAKKMQELGIPSGLASTLECAIKKLQDK